MKISVSEVRVEYKGNPVDAIRASSQKIYVEINQEYQRKSELENAKLKNMNNLLQESIKELQNWILAYSKELRGHL